MPSCHDAKLGEVDLSKNMRIMGHAKLAGHFVLPIIKQSPSVGRTRQALTATHIAWNEFDDEPDCVALLLGDSVERRKKGASDKRRLADEVHAVRVDGW